MRVSVSDLKKLESRVAYTFKNVALLDQSITHRSFGYRNNERLEFLGDSILNFVVASDLFSRFPEAKEGDLSRLRARLVKQQTLAEIARELDLGGFLTMGSGELKSGGFDRDSILSDAVEAIIGAVYLDSDIDTCKALILQWFAKRLSDIQPGNQQKDPKTQLQEYLQGRKIELPQYEVINTTGQSHDQEFTVRCTTRVIDTQVIAKGTSRRKAEQGAAQQVLALIKNAK